MRKTMVIGLVLISVSAVAGPALAGRLDGTDKADVIVALGPGREILGYWGTPDPADEWHGCERVVDVSH